MLPCSAKYTESSLKTVPIGARVQVYSKLNVYIPKGNRCCIKHLVNKNFISNQVVSTYNNLSVVSNTSYVSAEEITKFFDALRLVSKEEIHDKIGNQTFPEKRILELTGFNY